MKWPQLASLRKNLPPKRDRPKKRLMVDHGPKLKRTPPDPSDYDFLFDEDVQS